ncbi:MAG: transcription-repair coupling factor, partial [Acetobacteraceae bacterium]
MKPTTVFGAPEGFDALLLARRAIEHRGSILHVARDDARLARMAEALACFAPALEVLRFPAWDCLPYDRVSPKPELVSERVATLARLVEQPRRRRIVLTTVNALVQRTPPRAAFAGKAVALAAGGTADITSLLSFL